MEVRPDEEEAADPGSEISPGVPELLQSNIPLYFGHLRPVGAMTDPGSV